MDRIGLNNKLRINIKRVIDNIEQLSVFGFVKNLGICRLALSDSNKVARDYIVSLMNALEMEISIDKVGNILGLRKGTEDLPPVMTGSHIDTVSSGGKYDGSLGVLAGLEVIKTLNENNIETKRPLAVTVFTNEEGIRYNPDMMGSLAYSGGIPIDKVLNTVGNDGTIFAEELEKIGYAGNLECGKIIPDAFIELHVEQGPVLFNEKIPIGVVGSLTGISWQEISFTGEENHAGTTPIKFRKDAGLAAARTICFINFIVKSIGGKQLGTCGSVEFSPNNINVIPGKAKITVDLRNNDKHDLEIVESELEDYLKNSTEMEGINVELKQLVRLDPVDFDKNIIKVIEKTSESLGLKHKKITSGAGHDAQMMSRICPTAMIFIPSKDGISHNINEYSSEIDIENGGNLLLHSLIKLANR